MSGIPTGDVTDLWYLSALATRELHHLEGLLQDEPTAALLGCSFHVDLTDDCDQLQTCAEFADLLLFSWAARERRAQATAGEHRHADEGIGGVKPVGSFRQTADVGVGRF